jgi:hypothetical protein
MEFFVGLEILDEGNDLLFHVRLGRVLLFKTMALPVVARSSVEARMRVCVQDTGFNSGRPLLPPARGDRCPAPVGSARTALGGSIGRIRFGLEAGSRCFLKVSAEMADELTGI